MKRYLAIFVSALAMGGLAALALKRTAAVEVDRHALLHARLAAAAESMDSAVAQGGEGLSAEADGVAQIAGLSGDLKAMALAVAAYRPGSRSAKAVSARIAVLRERLVQKISKFLADAPRSSWVTAVNGDGVVMYSDAPHFAAGAPAVPGRTAMPGADSKKDEVRLPVAIKNALAGKRAEGTWVAKGELIFAAAAPVLFKGRQVGAIVVERPFDTLPQPAFGNALMVIDGAVAIGDAPDGATLGQAPAGGDAFLLAPMPRDRWTVAGIPLGPFYVDTARAGVWARRFSVPGTEIAWGLVTADLGSTYAEIAESQTAVVVTGVIFWVLLGAMILWASSPASRSTDISAAPLVEHLLQINQGGELQRFNSRRVAPPLRPLAEQLNVLIGSYVSGGAPAERTASPRVDDVLGAYSDESALADADDGDGFAPLFGGSDGVDPNEVELGASDVQEELPPELGAEFDSPTLFDDITGGATAVSPAGHVLAPGVELDTAGDVEAVPAGKLSPSGGDVVEDASLGAADVDAVVDDGESFDAELAAMDDDLQSGAAAGHEAVAASEASAPAPEALGLAEPVAVAQPGPQPTPVVRETAGDDAARGPVAPSAELLANLLSKKRGSTPAPVGDTDASAPAVASAPPAVSAPTNPGSDTSASAPGVTGNHSGDTAHFREVFDEFVATRQRCGEHGELSFDKFAVRLEQSRTAMLNKHGGVSVRFQVYVKNGKAALKATPAR